MKSNIFFTLLLFSIFCSGVKAQSTDYLFGVQDKVLDARNSCFQNDTDAALTAVLDTLNALPSLGNNHWKEYWTAYGYYHLSIYYAYNQNPDVEKAKTAVESAITLLDELENKNSEDYALLGYMKGYSLQWKSGFAMAKESAKASKWVKMAMDIDKQNPRAVFAFANNNFYTPAIFGGGKKADEYFTRSIALFKDAVPNPLVPSWGMDEAYTMLVRTKLKADKNDEAGSVLGEGLEYFPNNRNLKNLQEKMSQ